MKKGSSAVAVQYQYLLAVPPARESVKEKQGENQLRY